MKIDYTKVLKFLFILFLYYNHSYSQSPTFDLAGNCTVTGTSGVWWDYQYKVTGTSTYSQSPIIQGGSDSVIKLNPFLSWNFRIRYYSYYGQPGIWGQEVITNNLYQTISKSVGYSYNFDSTPLNEGWRGYKLQNTTSNYNSNIVEVSNFHVGSSGKSVYMGWKSGYELMFVSPKISDLSTDKKFSIFAKSYQGSFSVILGTISNPYDSTTFHPLKTEYLNGANDFSKIEVFLNNYVGSDQYIAIKSNGNAGDIYFDDFSYEQSINCFDTTNLNVSNVTETNAVLNFVADAAQNKWEINLNDVTHSITKTIITTTNNNYLLENLTGNTAYQVKVRAICAPGLYSNWTTPQSFSTPCSSISSGYQTSFLETNYFNPCWNKIDINSNIYQAPIGGNTSIVPRTGTKNIEILNFNGISNNTYLITPYINDLDANKRIKFFLVSTSYGSDYNATSLTIGTMSDPNDENTFVPLKTILPSEMNEINGYKTNDYWKEHIVYLDNYTTTLNHHYIAIKQNYSNNSNNQGSFYIDDFTYESIPLCKEPVNLKLVKSSLDSATVSWENNFQSSGQWEIQYGISGFAIGSGTTILSSSSSVLLSNLNGFTDYDFYVRSKCGNNFSNWSDRGTFKTKCVGVNVGFTENFETGNFDLNTCWVRNVPDISNRFYNQNLFLKYINLSTSYYYNVQAHSGTKAIEINANKERPNYFENEKTILVTPRLIDLNNEKKISFWAYLPSSNYASLASFQIGTLSDPEDYTTFIPYQSINSDFGINQWKKYSVDFSGYYGTNKYVGIRIFTTNNNYSILIDDFSYESNGCTKPSNLLASQNSSTSALLSWYTNNSLNNCEIEYGLKGFTPGTGTIATVASNSYLLTNLISSTLYEYRVRNICNSSVVNWSTIYEFKISCTVNSPFVENFDAYLAPNILDPCWSTNDNPNANIWIHTQEYSFSNFNSAPNSLSMQITNDNKDAYLITPYLNDFSNTKKVKYWISNPLLNGGYDNNSQIVSIGLMSNPSDLNTFEVYEQIQINDIPAYGKEYNTDFSNYTGSKKFIAFKLSGTNVSYKQLYIDDFKYTNNNGCLEPINIQFLNITHNSTFIKWNDTLGQNITIEYGLTGFTPGSGIVVTSNSNQILINALMESTSYDFYFKTICSQTLLSSSVKKSIATSCINFTLPWLENFQNIPSYGLNQLPNCMNLLFGGLESINSSRLLNTNYYSPDHTLNGNGDSTCVLLNYYHPQIVTPPFELIAGVTYKFSLDARKAYEYSSGVIRLFVGRGRDNHYMEAAIATPDILSEYNYNTNTYYFTPLENGEYSFILQENSGPTDANMIIDNLSLSEGYTNIINNNNQIFDFQLANDPKLILEETESSKLHIITDVNNNKNLSMGGSQNSNLWKSSANNVWSSNQNNITKVNMKINSSQMNSLYLLFDLKQTFNNSNNESMFRVVVNGNVLGNIIKPSTNNTDAIQIYQFDLSQYLGSDLRISLQHIGKNNDNIGDNAYLDNIKFSPTPVLSSNENYFTDFTYYPNPVNDILHIENKELIDKIELYSITGQILKSEKINSNNTNLNLNTFSDGIYFVKCYSNEKNKIVKIVKN